MLSGLLFIILGGLGIYYSAALVEAIGRIPRAENNLWGTRQMYILWWFVSLFIWFALMLWVFQTWSASLNQTSNTQINWLNNKIN